MDGRGGADMGIFTVDSPSHGARVELANLHGTRNGFRFITFFLPMLASKCQCSCNTVIVSLFSTDSNPFTTTRNQE